MKVQCFLCDKRENIDPYSFVAKRLRNRPLTTYLCQECNERIASKTRSRREQRSSGEKAGS